MREDGLGVCGVNVVDGYVVVGAEEGEETLGAAVDVVAGDDFVGGGDEAGYDVEAAHAGGDG